MNLRSLALATFATGIALSVQAAPSQWTVASGGNDHFYEAVLAPSGIDWATAKANAITAGGYLATLTSAAENTFAFGLLAGNANFWITDGSGNKQGPWLGAFQPAGSTEPGGGWTWVTGEAFTFHPWAPNEPNNSSNAEDSLQFFGAGRNIPTVAQWNDARGTNLMHGYIVEFNALPVPEPESYALFAAGLLMTVVAARRRAGR